MGNGSIITFARSKSGRKAVIKIKAVLLGLRHEMQRDRERTWRTQYGRNEYFIIVDHEQQMCKKALQLTKVQEKALQ